MYHSTSHMLEYHLLCCRLCWFSSLCILRTFSTPAFAACMNFSKSSVASRRLRRFGPRTETFLFRTLIETTARRVSRAPRVFFKFGSPTTSSTVASSPSSPTATFCGGGKGPVAEGDRDLAIDGIPRGGLRDFEGLRRGGLRDFEGLR